MQYKIGVIGYGYVGKALADRLSVFFDVVCYEYDKQKVCTSKENNQRLLLTNKPNYLSNCNVYIVAVQTPIDQQGNPDLSFLMVGTDLVSRYVSEGDVVIYESTVYPGVTEDICGKQIEKNTGFKVNTDFYLAYSPERISPGDEKHDISNTPKIVAASCRYALEIVKEIYSKVTKEALFVAENIRTAEAAKLLENLQRDTNIALMNEYAAVMRRLGVNIFHVIDAANTKWNFNYCLPGFVGGHCIGVDTHYFIKVAQQVDINPKIAEAARTVNEKAISDIAEIVIRKLDPKKKNRICIAGIAYKENIGDIRNSASLKIAQQLEKKGFEVLLFDPLVNLMVAKAHKITLCDFGDIKGISALVCLTYHDIFNDFVFEKEVFQDPDNAIVIDPFNKLVKLQQYNQFSL